MALTLAMIPTIQKPAHFCQNFKWILTKLQPSVLISNCWACGSDSIQNSDYLHTNLFVTIQNPDLGAFHFQMKTKTKMANL